MAERMEVDLTPAVRDKKRFEVKKVTSNPSVWWASLGKLQNIHVDPFKSSLVPRPRPAFCRLQYGKSGRGPGIYLFSRE